jgi:hypothetical protein
MDQLQAASSAPEIDFSKDTITEQMPQAKTVGGEEVKAPGSEMDLKAGGMGAAQTIAKGGSAQDAAASGLMATGHPVAMGAGLALMTHSTIQKKKAEQRQQEYLASLQQAESRRAALNNLANIGQNLRA